MTTALDPIRACSALLLIPLLACNGDADDDTGGSGDDFAAPCHPVTLDASVCDHETGSFTLDSTNPWYPLDVGLTVILEGEEDGELARVERTVLAETRTVAGVETHVLEHKEYIDGEIYEIAYNFYVEATDGTVCYFGEDVEFYEGGELANTDGTWRVGEDGAKPGIIMPADPQVGAVYYQELAPGSAEDMGRISGKGESMTVGGQDFDDVLTIMDSNPIDDEDVCVEERKLYVAGIGEISDAHLELVAYTPAP